MASIIRIKRSGITPVPNTLASGELAYSWESTAKGKLYIGWGDELTAGVAPNIAAIGGKYYTDLVSDRISHIPGELTVSSALIVDGTGTIDQIKVGNLDLSESTITSTLTDSNIIINPNGTGKTVISDLYINNDTTSLSAYIEQIAGGAIIAGAGLLSTAGTGAEEGSTILSVRVDDSTIEIKGAGDDILQLKDGGITNIKIAETTIANSKLVNSSVTIGGTGGVTQSLALGGTLAITGVTDGAITTDASTVGSLKIAVATASTTTLGVAKFAAADFGVSVGGEVTLDKSVIKSITTDSVSGALVSTTNAISIRGGTAIGVTHSGSVITVAAAIATTSAVGVASFNSTEFTVSGAGEVAINAGGIANSKLANSAITLGTTLLTLGNTGATAVLELAGLQKLNVDNIQIDNNDITSTTGNINLTALAGNDVNITATGLGNIDLSVGAGQEITLSTLAVADLTENGIIVAGADGALQTSTDLTFNGTTLDLNGTLEVGNISITGNTISSIDTNGNIVLSPNGTGETRGTVDVSSARITNVGSPTTGTDAANKQYVDDVAQGLKILPQAIAFSNSNLSATYNNGTAGVGATLTASANGTFPTIDGITLAADENVIINGQTNKAQNGSYILTTVGSAGTPWVLTRAPFIDQASEMEGSFEFVTSGTEFGNTGWVLTSLTEPVVVGTTDLTWVQFSGAGTYLAGVGLALTGNSFSVLVDNSSIEIDVDTLRVKAGGITNDMLAGSIENGKLINSKIVIQDQNAVTDDISLGDTLTFTVGTGTGITTAVTANTVTISGIDATDTVKGVAKFDATDFTVDTGDVTLKVQRIHDIVDGLVAEGQAMTITYDDPAGLLTFAANTATISALGVAKFGGYSSTVFDTINNVDTGVEDTNSSRQFSVSSGNVRIVALDGGTF